MIPKYSLSEKNMISFPPSWKEVILVDHFLTTFSPSRNYPDGDPHLISSDSMILGSVPEWSGLAAQYSLLRVCSYFDSSVCLVCCGLVQRAMVQEGVLKMGHEGWHSSRGYNQSFYWHHWAQSLQGGGGGWGWLKRPNMPWHMKGLVDHSLWGDWIQRRRPLAGQKKRWAWLYITKKKKQRPAGTWLEATLLPSPSSSTNWPLLISSIQKD